MIGDERERCQWRRGDTCIANLNGTRTSAVNGYVIEVNVRDRTLRVMHGWGDCVWVYMEWCYKGDKT